MAQNQSGKDSQKSSSSKKTGNSGNFKNNPEKASEAGRKGGEHSHGGSSK
ncbi:MAG: stress-induced protein [Sphingobacteriales bacterium]|nr:MAG: stress-induced protein [Sphingobacteriales bacterium]